MPIYLYIQYLDQKVKSTKYVIISVNNDSVSYFSQSYTTNNIDILFEI